MVIAPKDYVIHKLNKRIYQVYEVTPNKKYLVCSPLRKDIENIFMIDHNTERHEYFLQKELELISINLYLGEW
jgi:hypothetical protein